MLFILVRSQRLVELQIEITQHVTTTISIYNYVILQSSSRKRMRIVVVSFYYRKECWFTGVKLLLCSILWLIAHIFRTHNPKRDLYATLIAYSYATSDNPKKMRRRDTCWYQ
jgi:hypothetical protein